MSRKYEGLIVLNVKGADTGVEELISAVTKELEEEGAKVGEVKQLGRRKFAYPVRNTKSGNLESGHYVNYSFQADPSAVAKITARLKLNASVHLQHYQAA